MARTKHTAQKSSIHPDSKFAMKHASKVPKNKSIAQKAAKKTAPMKRPRFRPGTVALR